MRIHYFQHVAFEGVASIGQWTNQKGYALSATRFFEESGLPDMQAIDWLIIMGGPMNIYEHDRYPWLISEKQYIRAAIGAGKTVVGICLGAQLIADVLGAKVYPGVHKEIGWLPIQLTGEAIHSDIFGFLPEHLTCFQWHGDTFDLPDGSVHLAKSEGCENQAFIYDNRVLALQFHLESTPESVADIISHCQSEIVPGTFIQSSETIEKNGIKFFDGIRAAMFGILDRLGR
jgi:GMP synthase (glutamine-hydrolysing)